MTPRTGPLTYADLMRHVGAGDRVVGDGGKGLGRALAGQGVGGLGDRLAEANPANPGGAQCRDDTQVDRTISVPLMILPWLESSGKPVTQQVATIPVSARPSPTVSDCRNALSCGNQT
jgi:hypothetical protein